MLIIVGFGVFTVVPIDKGSFICEYRGNLITEEEGESIYEHDQYVGNFLYFFRHGGKRYWYVCNRN